MRVGRQTPLLFILTLGAILIQTTSSTTTKKTPTNSKPGLADKMISKPGLAERLSTLPPSERRLMVQVLEKRLLNMFGLSKKPDAQGEIHIPQYMMDLYRAQLDDPSLNFNLRGQALQNANTARSFLHTENPSDRQHYPDDNKVKFYFNVSSMASDESLTAAELRVYIEGNITHRRPEKHRVDIYEIMKPATSKNEAVTRLIDTKTVKSKRTRWVSFDVHPAVSRWREDSKANHGLEVHVSSVSDSDIQPRQKHIRLRRSVDVAQGDTQWLREQPFLVTFSDDGKNTRSKRSTTSSKSKNSKRRRRRRNRRNKSRRNKKYRKTSELCRRHSLYVDFADVGWKDWIVAPPGYDAYFCEGECVFPIPDHYNATNHAIVQTLVNSVSPKAVPRACCVPTDLSAISMLYIDDYGKVVLKNYQDMVVEGCGCR